MISRILISACVTIILFLGSVHLAYPFFTHKFSPTEGHLETAMKQVAPRISGETTMWKAWIGFHVSHSMGLILFGLIFGYLAVCSYSGPQSLHLGDVLIQLLDLSQEPLNNIVAS